MGSTMRRHVIPIAAAAFLALASLAQAQQPPAEAQAPPEESPAPAPQTLLEAPDSLPPRPSNGPAWRRITNFTTGTDSPCIGDATTPRCAIDTYIAWWVRGDPSLDWVAPNFPSAGLYPPRQAPDWFLSDHTIFYLGPVNRLRMPSYLEWRPAPETILAVVIPRHCERRRDIAKKKWDCRFVYGGKHRLYLLLERRANRWRIVDTFTPQI